MIYYTDGGGYNGVYSTAAVIRNGEVIINEKVYQGFTSNEMEYTAMIYALRLVKSGDVVYSDSQLVVNQLNGRWDVNADKLNRYTQQPNNYYLQRISELSGSQEIRI